MSIEMPSQSPAPTSTPEQHKSKSSKKIKSSHGEKKRKRDGEDSEKSKSKKHKADGQSLDISAIELAPSASQTPKSSKKKAQTVKLTSQSSEAVVENGQTSKPKKSHKKQQPAAATTEIPENISPFHLQTSSLYLGLAPISQKAPLEGLCAEHISPLILTYYPPFKGILLSYSNPRLSETPFGDDGSSTLLQNIDEYAVSWAWLTADFLLFKPETGAWLEGYVNLQNEGHLGVVCWNLFNASIERKRLPEDWKWKGVEDEEGEGEEEVGQTYAEDGIGYWVNGEGEKVDGMVKFRVKCIETSHDRERGFLTLEGTMLGEEAEKDMVYSEKQEKVPTDMAGRRLGGPKALGATSLAVPKETDMMDVDEQPKKHKQNYKW